MRLNNVVLPAPFGPMIALRSPPHDAEGNVAGGFQAAEVLGHVLELENRDLIFVCLLGSH